jgi:dTMP kinase
MPARGKLIVLEGIDGSGKRTQLEMLARAFAERGVDYKQISFPRYDGFFGKLVARFLNGEFGALDAVDAHFSALLYAGDRLEAKPAIEAELAAGRNVLCDRYIGSNLAHQSAMVPRGKRKEFLRWLKQLEYKIYALPAEDLVIYLRLPAAEAQRLVGEKGRRKYTMRRRDILEANLAHLKTASEVYDDLARQPNWAKVECAVTHIRGVSSLRTPEEIHQDVFAAIEKRVFRARRAARQIKR